MSKQANYSNQLDSLVAAAFIFGILFLALFVGMALKISGAIEDNTLAIQSLSWSVANERASKNGR